MIIFEHDFSKKKKMMMDNQVNLSYFSPVSVRVNPNSLSSPFPLVLRVHVRVRANSGFDRGVGGRGRGRYPLKPRIFASLLEGCTQNTLIQIIQSPIYVSIFSLNNLFKNYDSLVLCSTQSCTYIFATMFLIETFLKKSQFFHANVILLICTTVLHFSD